MNVKLFKLLKLIDMNHNTDAPTKTAAYYISPIEIGLLWAKITYVKSRSKALGFELQTDMK